MLWQGPPNDRNDWLSLLTRMIFTIISITIAKQGPLGGALLALLIQLPADFTILGDMKHADKRMNPLHCGSDPAHIRIRINPEIRIRILDHFCNFWDIGLGGGLRSVSAIIIMFFEFYLFIYFYFCFIIIIINIIITGTAITWQRRTDHRVNV